MRRVTAPLMVLALVTVLAPVSGAEAESASGPCDSTDTYALGGFNAIDDLGCNGTAVCPDNGTATPCDFELTVTIAGVGVFEAAGFAQGTTDSCIGPLGCTFTIPFTVGANSTAAWACWGGVRSAGIDATLTCGVN